MKKIILSSLLIYNFTITAFNTSLQTAPRATTDELKDFFENRKQNTGPKQPTATKSLDESNKNDQHQLQLRDNENNYKNKFWLYSKVTTGIVITGSIFLIIFNHYKNV